jgi:hypothetical protein
MAKGRSEQFRPAIILSLGNDDAEMSTSSPLFQVF